MSTLISITIYSIMMLVGITAVAGILLFTANALVSNTVEDQPDDH